MISAKYIRLLSSASIVSSAIGSVSNKQFYGNQWMTRKFYFHVGNMNEELNKKTQNLISMHHYMLFL